jgi:hypothetical protein
VGQPVSNLPGELAEDTLHFLQGLLHEFHPRNFGVALWDGTRWPPEEKQFSRFIWKIQNPGALRDALFAHNRELALAQAYLEGDFDLEGDLEAIFPLADYLIHKKWNAGVKPPEILWVRRSIECGGCIWLDLHSTSSVDGLDLYHTPPAKTRTA